MEVEIYNNGIKPIMEETIAKIRKIRYIAVLLQMILGLSLTLSISGCGRQSKQCGAANVNGRH